MLMTNTGTAPLSISSIAVTGANASQFVFANNCGSSLPVGAGCYIHGHFQPSAAGSFSANVVITDNASSSPQTIALSGTGNGPLVSLSGASVAFTSTCVGASSNSESVSITNAGNEPLSIANITVTGANASQFAFGNNCGTTLAPGVNCLISGKLQPSNIGAFTAAVTITDNAGSSPQTIALSGTGVGRQVTLSVTSISFGTTAVGALSASQWVAMTNTGTVPLSIGSINVTGANAAHFVFGNTCGSSLAVGASCFIHGHFQPTAKGTFAATVTIADSATGSPQTIALSGTGQ